MNEYYLLIKNLKIPTCVRIFNVDRGGVEPLEQADRAAPETTRTRPSNPQDILSIFLQIEKLPCGSSSE
jgi:hypothetical protein